MLTFSWSLLWLLLPWPPPSEPPIPESLYTQLEWRSIGPAGAGGRITDLEVLSGRPSTFYVGTAGGGLFKTTNNGTTFKPLFQHLGSSSIGDVALDPSRPETVWVGTGESNLRNSVSWGDGIYRSDDGGRKFRHCGLKETRHIGRVVVHPENSDLVFVAALGRTWGSNEERGLYRTRDGGQSWEKVLYVDSWTGCVDVALDPNDPSRVYAATYEHLRDASDIGPPRRRTGPGSALWRSKDGGDSWTRLSKGLPTRPMGRIGLQVDPHRQGSVYAIVETDWTGRAPESIGNIDAESADLGRFSVGMQGGQIANIRNQQGPDGHEFGGLFHTDDHGETWRRINSLNPRPFYYSQVRVDPGDPHSLYVLGIALHRSGDGGANFDAKTGRGAHPDHHALWIDPQDGDHLISGNDGGLFVTWDRGENWEFLDTLPIAQFYNIAVDNRAPYHIYGGLQDNGTWVGPSVSSIKGSVGANDWTKLYGGDGFRCAVDKNAPHIVYCESQNGGIIRIDLQKGERSSIRRPKGDALFNWNTPFLLSPHNSETLLFAGNVVYESIDRGDHSRVISPKISRNPQGTATALDQSPVDADILYVGTDDGALSVSIDGGESWHSIAENLPALDRPLYVSDIVASNFSRRLVYVTLDGHRSDDNSPYIFVSRDAGRHWTRLGQDLPVSPVYCLVEDPDNPETLFIGTEHGCHVSIDAGDTWTALDASLPTVAVRDLVIHPREHELIAATHGRGLWILDITPFKELDRLVLETPSYLFEVEEVRLWNRLPETHRYGARRATVPNPETGAHLYYYLQEDLGEKVRLEIRDTLGEVLITLTGSGRAGLHHLVWDLYERPIRAQNPDGLVSPGDYGVTMKIGEDIHRRRVRVLPDPRIRTTDDIVTR